MQSIHCIPFHTMNSKHHIECSMPHHDWFLSADTEVSPEHSWCGTQTKENKERIMLFGVRSIAHNIYGSN